MNIHVCSIPKYFSDVFLLLLQMIRIYGMKLSSLKKWYLQCKRPIMYSKVLPRYRSKIPPPAILPDSYLPLKGQYQCQVIIQGCLSSKYLGPPAAIEQLTQNLSIEQWALLPLVWLEHQLWNKCQAPPLAIVWQEPHLSIKQKTPLPLPWPNRSQCHTWYSQGHYQFKVKRGH